MIKKSFYLTKSDDTIIEFKKKNLYRSKNDLPCRIWENEFDKDYITIIWRNAKSDAYHGRNNDLPSFIECISYNSNIYYATEYGMYDMYYRYNGYAYYSQSNEKHYNFINGISIEYISVCINEDDEDYDND